MAKFMMLLRNVGDPMVGVSEEDRGAIMQSWGKYMVGLGDKLVDGLPFSGGGKIVSASGTKDGRHEEGNVNVGGYLIVNAASIDEAVELSKGCPALQNSTTTIEVRECMNM